MRIVIQKDGVTTDVPENELLHYLQLGFVKVGTLPDALPADQQKPTAEDAAVNDAAVKVAAAEQELADAQLAAQDARDNKAPQPKKGKSDSG